MSDTPLHELALLTDAHGAALVNAAGTIEWCCLPRFDSGSCFAHLLDTERGGACVIESEDGPLRADGARYDGDTFVLMTDLAGGHGAGLRVRDALVPGDGPRRLVRELECTRGTLTATVRIMVRFDYGEVRPWVRMHGDHAAAVIGGDDALAVHTHGQLTRVGDHELRATARLGRGDRLGVTLTSVAPPDADAAAAGPAPSAADELWRTADWWAGQARALTASRTADPALRRSALVLRGLVYDPTGAIIAAPTTSLPEAPTGSRNWDYRYAWVRDATFASRALARLGATDVADAFARFVMRSAAGHADDLHVLYGVGGERRIGEHELDLHGYRGARPVHVGNGATAQVQRDEPGEILQQSHHRHQRGQRFDEDEWRFLHRVVEHVADHWREPDRGFWEWRGQPRQFVHSKAACAAALTCGLQIAEADGHEVPEERWRAERDAALELVLAEGFDEAQGTFVQAVGHRGVDATALLLPHTGVVAWDDPRMCSTVDVLGRRLDDHGLLRRYDEDDGLPGREGCFLACSFWLAECLWHQGRHDEAQATFDRAAATASPLGLFSEEYDPERQLPLGNYPQGLTHLAHLSASATLAGEASDVDPPHHG